MAARTFVLGDLEAQRQVKVEIMLSVECRASVYGGPQRQPRQNCSLDAARVQHLHHKNYKHVKYTKGYTF